MTRSARLMVRLRVRVRARIRFGVGVRVRVRHFGNTLKERYPDAISTVP